MSHSAVSQQVRKLESLLGVQLFERTNKGLQLTPPGVAGRRSPNSLYDAEVASMEGGGSYNQDDAEGFLRIMGLPSRVQGSVTPREY